MIAPLAPGSVAWSSSRRMAALYGAGETAAGRPFGDLWIGDLVHRPRMHAGPLKCCADRHIGNLSFPPSLLPNQSWRGVSPDVGREAGLDPRDYGRRQIIAALGALGMTRYLSFVVHRMYWVLRGEGLAPRLSN